MRDGSTRRSRCSEQSVRLNSSEAAPHHDLGVALLAAGRIEEAAEPIAAALRLDPGIATAHYCLGYIFDCLGQPAKAMRSFQSAVGLNPDLVEAQMRLGDLYLARGLRAESAAAFRAAAASAEGTVTARIAEARALEVSGAPRRGARRDTRRGREPSGERRGPCRPRQAARPGGTCGGGRSALRARRRAFPALSHAWSGVATNRKFTPDDRPRIARMSAALARSDLTPRQRLLLHFALGKAQDDLGDYEAAMQNFEAGNRIRARGGRLGRDTLTRRVDQLIEATPRGYRERQPDLGVEDATPILIVGMPRSGTTLTRTDPVEPSGRRGGRRTDVLGRARAPRRGHLGAVTATRSGAAPRGGLSRDAAGVRARRETGHRQIDRAFHRCSGLSIASFPTRSSSTAGAIRSTTLCPFSPRISKETSTTPRTAATSSSTPGSTSG